LRVLWWAPISVIGLYLSACLVFGTGPLYLAYGAVSEIGGLFLVAAILVGAFWALDIRRQGLLQNSGNRSPCLHSGGEHTLYGNGLFLLSTDW